MSPPHRSPEVVRASRFADETGWIPIDGKTLKTKWDNIYAIGDVATVELPGRFQPDIPLRLSKAGVSAHYQAKIVAENIANEILGRPERKEYDGRGYYFLEVGYGRAGFTSTQFYALPHPKVKMKSPSRIWHWNRILFEKYWFWHYF